MSSNFFAVVASFLGSTVVIAIISALFQFLSKGWLQGYFRILVGYSIAFVFATIGTAYGAAIFGEPDFGRYILSYLPAAVVLCVLESWAFSRRA